MANILNALLKYNIQSIAQLIIEKEEKQKQKNDKEISDFWNKGDFYIFTLGQMRLIE